MNVHLYAIVDRKGNPVYIGFTRKKWNLRQQLLDSYKMKHFKIRKWLEARHFHRVIWLGDIEVYDGKDVTDYLVHCVKPELNQ